MNTRFDLAIVIPCYNEAQRLRVAHYKSFLKQHPKAFICFVNDGSTDETLEVLEEIRSAYPSQVFAINQSKNQGKAEAVRTGVLHCGKEFYAEKIAYLDADLSTSLEECLEISEKLSSSTYFAFGSRIAKLDCTIDRKHYRFLIGRCIATLISRQLNLKIYDTQCGCKVFKQSLGMLLFQEKFISRWLFDVELFHRLIAIYGRRQLKDIAKEIPLQSWCDTDDSKVPLSYFFKLWIDLRNIGKAYKNTNKQLSEQNETILE
ncbi:glycosyltransferase [uncultured Tenacibaculum sp.]|uniref:glycosyltransferase n=1 Tax=uncultured Tenacibaculum sp. TaxID=174713 RepID=UPI00263989EC|nr:glycosyltransferase [uncultured Tenacibaculum sp.]